MRSGEFSRWFRKLNSYNNFDYRRAYLILSFQGSEEYRFEVTAHLHHLIALTVGEDREVLFLRGMCFTIS